MKFASQQQRKEHSCCRLKAIDFLGRKINNSGISPAKRIRSGQNSVHVDTSRGDNVHKIFDAIGPFWAKWGLRRVPRSASFFCLVNQVTFRQLFNGRFLPNLVTEHIMVSRRGIREDISNIFTVWVICPQNLKTKLSQTGTSLRAGYRSRDVLQRDTVYTAL